MQIYSSVFGPVEVEENNLLHMPLGIYGFEDITNYALISQQDGDVTLRWLQAAEAELPCFVVFNPLEILHNYSPQLSKEDFRAMDCPLSELEYLVIAVVPEDVSKTTVNLKSPIVFNRKTHVARQVILSNVDYPIRYSLAANQLEDAASL